MARLSLATSEAAVKKRASVPARQAARTSALAMWVLPVPTSPTSTRSSRLPRKASDSRSARGSPSGNDTGDQS